MQSYLQRLRESLPATCNLIDQAQWRSHNHHIAELIAALKDTVDDADDLLDEFRWHELKLKIEGSTGESSFLEFFDNFIEGSFNRMNDIQERPNNLSRQLESGLARSTTTV